MNGRVRILCPIDFSEASASALKWAVAIAAEKSGRVTVLTVEDPLLTEAMDLATGVFWSRDDCAREMAHFASHALGPGSPMLASLDYDVAVGKPGPEILRVADEKSCDLIVISTHGLSGFRKLFFGSTTERVLRETTRPVLVTTGTHNGRVSREDVKRLVRRIVVPVDLTAGSLHQARIARELAEALGVGLILVHVVEPVKSRLAARLHLAGVEADRRAVAEDGLNELVATFPPHLHAEALVAYGDPAEELAKVVREREAGLVVIGLHGSPLLGPRMGSVTYRLLCLTPSMVLALPPARPLPQEVRERVSTTVVAEEAS